MSILSCQNEPKPIGSEHAPLDNYSKQNFWQEQRKGTNYFNETPTKEWFDAASEANIKLIRFTYEKWSGAQRDFLLGSADEYTEIVESDFRKLKHFLDYAQTLGMKIVITPISLPGARWIQMNDNVRDKRLWKDFKYHEQAMSFWRDLATRLKDHPAVVGYNIINEPHPELAYRKHNFWDGSLSEWYQGVKNGPGDLNLFYDKIVRSIRSVDSLTPIIVESGLFGTPWAFDYLKPIEDEHIMYSFHMYEPYGFTTKRINQGRYSYPTKMQIEGLPEVFNLDKDGLNDFFQPIRDWIGKHDIPSNRIWVGEFGCNRQVDGAQEYIKDLVTIFNQHNWHWSFYAYREDVWEAMDYELGKNKVHYKYWDYQEAKNLHLNYEKVYAGEKDNSLWNVFAEEFR